MESYNLYNINPYYGNGPPQIDPSTYVIYDLSISLNPWHLWRLRFGFLEVLHGARTNGQTICAISTVQPDNHLVLLNGERMCNSEWSGLKESKESYIKKLLSNRRIVLRYVYIYIYMYVYCMIFWKQLDALKLWIEKHQQTVRPIYMFQALRVVVFRGNSQHVKRY